MQLYYVDMIGLYALSFANNAVQNNFKIYLYRVIFLMCNNVFLGQLIYFFFQKYKMIYQDILAGYGYYYPSISIK